MTPQPAPEIRPLCPHLAAAVLWMSKPTRKPRRAKSKIRYVRASGRVMDDLLAL